MRHYLLPVALTIVSRAIVHVPLGSARPIWIATGEIHGGSAARLMAYPLRRHEGTKPETSSSRPTSAPALPPTRARLRRRRMRPKDHPTGLPGSSEDRADDLTDPECAGHPANGPPRITRGQLAGAYQAQFRDRRPGKAGAGIATSELSSGQTTTCWRGLTRRRGAIHPSESNPPHCPNVLVERWHTGTTTEMRRDLRRS